MLRILIADDEVIIRKGMEKMLKAYSDFSVVGCVSNGQEVLEFIEENGEPDCVISDVKMPVMDGVMLVRHLSKEYPLIKIVMFSGFDDFTLVRDTLRMGAINYLLKPIDEKMLVAVLNDIVYQLDNSKDEEALKTVENRVEKIEAHIHINKKIEFAKQYILHNYSEDLSLTKIANATYINASYLSSLFKNEMGVSVIEYLTQIRLEKSKEFLKTTEMSANEIAYSVGYIDQSYFSRVFKKNTGMTPIEYRYASRS